jgi:hypothetical protein
MRNEVAIRMKLRTAGVVAVVHRPEFKITRKKRFGYLISFRLQVRGGKHLLCWVT